jgi:four helix bundle protein
MKVRRHTELDVYQTAFDLAMQVFVASKRFPKDERYSLTDQIRRSSRSVCANLAEAWRKRRYEAHFVSKLSDAETEAAETQVWLQFAVECAYLERPSARSLFSEYDRVIAMIVSMIRRPQQWIIS